MNDILNDPNILNVFKPRGLTSFDVVRYVKRFIKDRKIGHGGTLDPFAEGVLLILMGTSTKRMPELLQYRKAYSATLHLGKKTDTADITGKILEYQQIPPVSETKISEVFRSLEGTQYQTPPMFSAKKKNGVPLYKYARRGETVHRHPREVQIEELSIVDYTQRTIKFHTVVSSGTYIRTLAETIAERLGTAGFLSELTRVSIGPFTVADSIKMKDIEKKWLPALI